LFSIVSLVDLHLAQSLHAFDCATLPCRTVWGCMVAIKLAKQAKHSRSSLSMQGHSDGQEASVLGRISITGIKMYQDHAASDRHDTCMAPPASVYVIESAA